MTFRPTKFPKPPAEVFCPGEFISDELRARKWGRAKFAHETRLPIEYVNGLLAGTKPLTDGPAQRIAQAFGTSVALWTRLERAYRTYLAAKPKPAKKCNCNRVGLTTSECGMFMDRCTNPKCKRSVEPAKKPAKKGAKRGK